MCASPLGLHLDLAGAAGSLVVPVALSASHPRHWKLVAARRAVRARGEGRHLRPSLCSAGVERLDGSSDEEDYRRAIVAKENFRRRRERSSESRGRDPVSPASSRAGRTYGRDHARDRSGSRRRTQGRESLRPSEQQQAMHKRPDPMPTPAPMQLIPDVSTGDLRLRKDERQLKKEAAARELEERRKSLARRHDGPSHTASRRTLAYRPTHTAYATRDPHEGSRDSELRCLCAASATAAEGKSRQGL